MRYVKARQPHDCVVCKEEISEGEVCIQSLSGWGHFYHESCHNERFQHSIAHTPSNERPE